MKKRVLIISLCLALLLMALAPATALAKDYRSYRSAGSTSFAGSGLIYVTYMPDPIIAGNIWYYQGEIVQGYLDICDWDLLAGTAFWSSHHSVVRVGDDGSACGMMYGTFTLTRPDGSGILVGTFTGRISGNLLNGNISDTGTWRSTMGTGVLKGVKAWGTWSGELHYDAIPGTDTYTLIGPLEWDGQYTGGSKTVPGKPVINPGKIIKPGKIVKPWRPISPWKLMFPWFWKK